MLITESESNIYCPSTKYRFYKRAYIRNRFYAERKALIVLNMSQQETSSWKPDTSESLTGLPRVLHSPARAKLWVRNIKTVEEEKTSSTTSNVLGYPARVIFSVQVSFALIVLCLWYKPHKGFAWLKTHDQDGINQTPQIRNKRRLQGGCSMSLPIENKTMVSTRACMEQDCSTVRV